MSTTTATYGATEPTEPRKPAAPAPALGEGLAPYFAEFLGTFVLVFTVGCCTLAPSSPQWSATAIACALMVMVYSTGQISGGNLNPAVSFSLGLTGALPWRSVLKYWVVQLAAGLAAGRCCCALFVTGTLAVGPQAPFSWGLAALAEALYSFMLCAVVAHCAASKRNNPSDDGNQFFALAIGFVVVAGGYAAGNISGACFNPAVALGLSGAGAGLRWGFAWTAAELAGALLAALAFRALRSEEFYLPRDGLATFAPKLRAKLLAEFVGTFMLVLTVGLNVTMRSPAVAFSAAAALMCMVYSLGNISGAHFNPAVTLAVVASGRGKCPPAEGAAYAAVQALAGVLAGLLYAGFHAAGPHSGTTFGLGPGQGFSASAAGAAELFFTFVLAYVVLSCATASRPASWVTRQNFYFALAIGSAVTAGGVAAGPVSGGELNPAVSLGIVAANAAHHGVAPPPSALFCLTFSCWQLGGGILAAAAFRLTHASEYRQPPAGK